MPRPAIVALGTTTVLSFMVAAALIAEQVLFPHAGALSPTVPIARSLPRETERAHPTPSRVTIAPSRGYIPIPPAPLEDGILGEITDARVSSEDRDAFYLMVEANRRVESGRPRFSVLRTTAGPSHRASWGVAQLVIRDHVERLLTMSDEELATLAVPRTEIRRASRSGEATIGWYEIIVGGRQSGRAAGLDNGESRALRALVTSLRRRALVATFGSRFHDTTGLPPDALLAMADTRVLAASANRAEFRRRYARAAGTPWEARSRQGRHIHAVVHAMVSEHPDLRRVFEHFGESSAAYAAVGHYLGVGDLNENMYGWYARAAATALGRRRYLEVLRVADPITTRLRELSNWQHAIAAVDGVPDLHGVERARMLTRVSRCFHGAPGRARQAFFFGGEYARPVSTTASELEAAMQEYRRGRMWSDDRVQTAFEELLVERGLVR